MYKYVQHHAHTFLPALVYAAGVTQDMHCHGFNLHVHHVFRKRGSVSGILIINTVKMKPIALN